MPGIVALAFAYVFSQFYRSFLAVLTPDLTEQLGATTADLSLASGVWFLAFAAMQFAVGVGLDRYGPRRTSAWLFGVFGSGGAFLFAAAQSPQTVVIAMGLIGIGCSPVLMAAVFIFAKRFDPTRFAVLSSWLVAFGNLGNVIGAAPLANASEAFGWRTVLIILGIGNLLVAAAAWRLVEDPEPDIRETASTDPARAVGASRDGEGYLALLRMPVLWLILPMVLFCYAPAAGLRGLWVGPYLADLFAANSLTIGRISLWMALAMVAGNLLYGPLDRLFDTRKHVVLAGNVIVLAALIVFITTPQPSLVIATLLFMTIGIAGTSYAVILAHGRAFVPAHLTGRGVTLLNFFSISGVGLMQYASGRVVSAQPDPSAVSSYRLLFVAYAIPVAVAMFIYLFSRDAKPSGRNT